MEQAEKQVTQANQDRIKAWQELDRFKERVSEVGNQVRHRHDMCGVYDDIMDELGLPVGSRSTRSLSAATSPPP